MIYDNWHPVQDRLNKSFHDHLKTTFMSNHVACFLQKLALGSVLFNG